MPSQAKFLTGSLFGHVASMSMAASIGLIAVFLVDFVDMIFISMLGSASLAAAIGYAGAILFFTTSFSIGLAIAGGALVAKSLGEGDDAKARHLITNVMIYSVILGAVFSFIVWMNIETLLGLVGAKGEALDLAVTYLSVIIPSLPLLAIAMLGTGFLRAYGDGKRAMNATLIAGVVNAILDPIFIFGFGLDLVGAAMATVCARIAMAVFAVLPLIKFYGGIERPSLRQFTGDIVPVFAIAIPAILTQLATPIGQAYVTRAMAEFGEAAVAGMAVVSRLTPVSFAVIFALSGAIGPIMAQNFGAKQYDRVSKTFHEGLIFIGIYVVFVTVILFFLREPIANLFGLEGIAVTLLYLFCGPLALAFFFNGVMFSANAAFNNLGHPFYSTWLNWGRHTLGTIPFVMIGVWLMGAPGVLVGQALGGVVFGVIAWILARRVMEHQGDIPEPAPFSRQARLLQLLHLRR